MKNIKRILSLFLALAMALSLMATALAADEFTDVKPNDWFYSDVMECAAQGIATGYDGLFRPNDSVTSVEFIAMLTRTFYADELSQVTTPDGQPWYYPNVTAAAELGIDSTLDFTSDPMSRNDMSRALFNIISKEGKALAGNDSRQTTAANELKDYLSVPVSRRVAVTNCYALGIITGMDGGYFNGDASMTRAQACTVIMRMLRLINGEVPDAADSAFQPPAEKPQEASEAVSGQTLANGKPVTVENVQEILEELREKYPDGTAYNTKFTDGGYGGDLGNLVQQWKVRDTNTKLGLQSGCGGFASVITDSIFGRNGFPCRRVTRAEDLRPGDIIIGYTDTTHTKLSHISIVYKVWTQNGTTYYSSCDNSNSGSRNGVMWNEPNQYNNGTNAAAPTSGNFLGLAYTRYPE